MYKKTFPLIFVLLGSLLTAAQAPASAQFNSPGRYEIESVESGLVLDVATEDRESIQQYPRRGRLNQAWDIQPEGNGFFHIQSADGDRALSPSGGPGRPGSRAVVSRQRGGEDQLWQIVSPAQGEFQIISKSGLALDVPHKSHEKGERLQFWTQTGDASQRFRLIFISATQSWRTDSSSFSPPAPAASFASGEAAVACRGEVNRHIADLPFSDIFADPISTDAQGATIVIWKTTRGSSGYCRVDRANRVTQFKIEELSQ